MQPLDLPTIPLTGVNLIEASAGTGKTHTICSLVLRLLLETELGIGQILVVTYTEAATEELRDKIRRRIRNALEFISRPDAGQDDALLACLAGASLDNAQSRQRLTVALRTFDEAAIYTIHGFCQRMLREHGFESGTLFDAELLTDEAPLIREIVEDFWRRHFYENASLFVEYAHQTNITPESLGAFASRHGRRSYQVVLPTTPAMDCTVISECEQNFLVAMDELRQAWPAARAEVEQTLLNDRCLHRNKYNPKQIPGWLAAMDTLTIADRSGLLLFDKFNKFTPVELARSTKGGQPPPESPFFELCGRLQEIHDALLEQYTQSLIALKAELLAFLRQELTLRKNRQNLFSFDDLLACLLQGLRGESGSGLARAIRQKYPAALIDEFQDTDPIQYEIFERIYRPVAEGSQDTGLLFLIGDPKQAIYGFRGADIFAYLTAARAAGLSSRFTLERNWRSTTGLITAVNRIFSRAHAPFVFQDITFAPMAAARQDISDLRIDHIRESSLKVWFFERPHPDQIEVGQTLKPMTKTSGREKILAAIAAEIVRLLDLGQQGRALLGDRAVTPADIAVLVRTNHEARLVRKTLTACRVPNVLHSSESLFASQEAWEMEVFLHGIAEPEDPRKLRAALATDFIGLRCDEIQRLADADRDSAADASSHEYWLGEFLDAREQWKRAGFLSMFLGFVSRHAVKARLLAFADGERRLTNILHLAELLQQAAATRGLGINSLRGHLADLLRRQPDDEEHQLRLESDGDCVQIVTVHKAKGLEYPLVFCPFLWAGLPDNPSSELLFHEKTAAGESSRLILDLGSPDLASHWQLATMEELAESLRLFYVALTRAKNCCIMAWGSFRGAETSAAAYLLHQPPTASADRPEPLALLNAVAERLPSLSDAELLAELDNLAESAPGAIEIVRPATGLPVPVLHATTEPAASLPLAGRQFAASLAVDWRTTSFTALVSGQQRTADLPDRDRLEPGNAASENPASVASILGLPPGTSTGIFLHTLLERLDFTNADPRPLIREMLQSHGLDATWEAALARMIDNLRAVPLITFAEEPGRPALTLATVPNHCRLNELEFLLPLALLSPAKLRRVFAAAGDSRRPDRSSDFTDVLANLDFLPVRGFMKGFIDLVFEADGRYYLVDWKSNYLGDSPAEYHQDRLAEVMAAEMYTLQYHIYAAALHRYLASRLPGYRYETHFGGVFYIFLRGVDLRHGPGFGIFRAVPPPALINELTAGLFNRAPEEVACR
ncbi:MAG: exodeoxyribonuclease V subunit beta [Deltaproteobacteria bacterium RIFOXYD12_FULL_57_12]|nr:MAG: exodeoxyribonuclease V subunit beta [Deltaproteobacteria bacterium RIFOXYD12_FULL_57_12]